MGFHAVDPAPEVSSGVALRHVSDHDLETFFEHQLDSDATRMAAFPARDREAHMAHWHKIMGDPTIATRTIVFDGRVAGNIVSWEEDAERQVGYWIGRSFWGKGVATAALSQFLSVVTTRPLYAYVARHNVGSIRVLEKCGFTVDTEHTGDDVDEDVLILTD